MKKKMAILIGIAVCVMLLTSPVLASAGYSKIYGNANEDDVLDMRDVTYIKLVIFGKKPATTFADANNDGKVSMLDIGQTKLIILGKEKQLTLIDQADRTVTVPRPIERIVTTGWIGTIRTLVHLGVADKIVGGLAVNPTSNAYLYLIACPDLVELPTVGRGYAGLNRELVVSLKPDVIFVSGIDASTSDAANTLQNSIDIPVVCVYWLGSEAQESFFEMYRLEGKVVGKEERAEELISYINEKTAEITEVTSQIDESAKPRVMFPWGGAYLTRPGTRYYPIEPAGGINVATGPGSTITVSLEQVIEWNPDIILIHSVWSLPEPHMWGKCTIEDVLSDPRLQTINAVKNRKLYYARGYSGGLDPAIALTEVFYFAKLFHPDKFEDLDVEKEGNEILKTFYGVDGIYTDMAEGCDLYRWE